MTDFGQLVVALGSVDGDSSLIEYAAVLARLGSAKEVRFVHVAEASALSPDLRSRMRAHVATHFLGSTAAIECDVLHGSLTDRLLDYVTEFQADLILIGSKKHKLGARLAMVAPCSVAVVPNGYPAKLSHLMVTYDFSKSAALTLQWATSLVAGDAGIRCTALHVVTYESSDMFAGNETGLDQAQRVR
jgi:nucleotide-binding universal stress UspA family protein